MSETLLSVLFGGVLTLLGGILGAFLQHRWETKRFRINQMKKAYETAQRFLIQVDHFNKEAKSREDLNNIRPVVENTAVLIGLYASKKVQDIFEEVSILAVKYPKTDDDSRRYVQISADLIGYMRADLGSGKSSCVRNSRILSFFHIN